MIRNRQTAPCLKHATHDIADHGAVRLGSGSISANFPPLRRPAPEVADHGAVRLGSGSISANFPIRK